MKNTSNRINPTLAQADQLPDSAHVRPKDCAMLLGISIATFWRLAKAEKLRTYKLTERTTSVKMADLRAFISDNAGFNHG